MGKSKWLKPFMKKFRKIISSVLKFFRALLKWITFIKIETDDGKYIKRILNWLNLVRVIILICGIPYIVLFFNNGASTGGATSTPTAKGGKLFPPLNLDNDWIGYLVLCIVIYLLFRLYFDWIKKLWEFLKKDSIVHYIFLALIPIAIIVLGFRYFPGLNINKSLDKKINGTEKGQTIENVGSIAQRVNDIQMIKNEYDETIDRLNGFYGALFTAIAVIAALLGLGVWRSIRELKEKLNEFNKFEKKVKFVKEKKELAEWAQNLFDKDNDKKIFSKLSLVISDEDKKKLDDVKKNVLEETTEDNWLKLVYAHELIDDDTKTDKEKTFRKAEKVYRYIEKRDLCKEDSDLRHILLHLMGLMYWNWYKFMKEEFKSNEFDKRQNTGWFQKWIKHSDTSEFLNLAEKYYKEALKELEERKINADETLRNLAIVLIEKSKFDVPEQAGIILEEAKEKLDDVIKKTYNDYWDKARIFFYLDRGKYFQTIRDLLLKEVVTEIENIDDKKFFIKYLKFEIEEKDQNGNTGFPGDLKLFDEVMKELKDC